MYANCITDTHSRHYGNTYIFSNRIFIDFPFHFIIKMIRRRPVKKILKIMGILIIAYVLVWLGCYFTSGYQNVQLGTDDCFDDWCATVLSAKELPAPSGDSLYIVLNVKMSNHARGIAQKPSEPRIYLIDGKGNTWPQSAAGQQLLERSIGKQPRLDTRLRLNGSVETAIVCSVPLNAGKLSALIEEGPWITKLLFPADRVVFSIR